MHVACYDDGPMNDIGERDTAGPRARRPTSGSSRRRAPTRSGPLNAIPAGGHGLSADAGERRRRRVHPHLRPDRIRPDRGARARRLRTHQRHRPERHRSRGRHEQHRRRPDRLLDHPRHTHAGSRDQRRVHGGIYDFQQTANSGPPLRITNNIIYGVTSTVFADDHHISGIHIASRTTSYVYNNTIYNIYNQGGGNPERGGKRDHRQGCFSPPAPRRSSQRTTSSAT